jgi:hypothetical protein
MRHKRLKLSAVLLLGFGLTGLQAQEAIPATGSNASGSGGSVSYTVGQVVYTTNSGTNGSVIQGVQQPYEISVVSSIEETIGINLTVTAYPNPTTDFLTLSVDNFETSNLLYQLYDTNGKLLESKKIEGNQTSIVMSNLVPDSYFLKVIQNKNEVHNVISNKVGAKQFNVVKTFKIIKN